MFNKPKLRPEYVVTLVYKTKTTSHQVYDLMEAQELFNTNTDAKYFFVTGMPARRKRKERYEKTQLQSN